MSNCMTCFGRGVVYGSDGQLKTCPTCNGNGFTPEQLFTALYREYERMVRGIAASALNYQEADLVDDIAQDTWLQVWTCVQRGVDLTRRPARGLIATITYRMVGMHYRRVTARPRTRPLDPTDTLVQHLLVIGTSAEDVASARLAARDRLATTAPHRRRQAPLQTERLLALAVTA